MKTVFNIVLGVCAIALVYICYASIMGPINFEKLRQNIVTFTSSILQALTH